MDVDADDNLAEGTLPGGGGGGTGDSTAATSAASSCKSSMTGGGGAVQRNYGGRGVHFMSRRYLLWYGAVSVERY